MSSERTEYDVHIFFKHGGQFRTARMTEEEAKQVFENLDPALPQNLNIKEIQLYKHVISEDSQFLKRRPTWGTV